jgi:hypothetical protein
MLRIDPAIRALFSAASCSRRSPDHCVKDALIVIPNSKKLELVKCFLFDPPPLILMILQMIINSIVVQMGAILS